MILDRRALLSDAQAIVATAVSTDSYDLGAPGKTYDGTQLKRNMGKAGMIPLLIQVVENFNLLTSLTFTLQTDEDSAFGSPKNVIAVTVPLAELVAGFILPIDKLPRGIVERYVRLNYTVAGTDPTEGAVTAGFVAAVDGAYVG